jgi:hypothetical protein
MDKKEAYSIPDKSAYDLNSEKRMWKSTLMNNNMPEPQSQPA